MPWPWPPRLRWRTLGTLICTTLTLLWITYAMWTTPRFRMPFLMSLVSGLSTVLGALLMVARGRHAPLSRSHLALVCGCAIGVMCYVALFSMLLPAALDADTGAARALVSAALGACLLVFIVSPLLSSPALLALAGHHSHQPPTDNERTLKHDDEHTCDDVEAGRGATATTGIAAAPSSSTPPPALSEHQTRTMRFGLLTAIVLGLHNLPEGLAVFVSTIDSQRHGILMTIAIAMHNVPEGLIVATPLFAATGNWQLAVTWTALSGCTEPVGAFLSMLFLRDYLTPHVIHLVLSFVAGIMLSVSITELLPEGFAYGQPRSLSIGIAVGVLLLFLTNSLMDAIG